MTLTPDENIVFRAALEERITTALRTLCEATIPHVGGLYPATEGRPPTWDEMSACREALWDAAREALRIHEIMQIEVRFEEEVASGIRPRHYEAEPEAPPAALAEDFLTQLGFSI